MGRENEYHFISAAFNFILCDKVSKGSAVVAILKISRKMLDLGFAWCMWYPTISHLNL